jgi:hypothetical protein
MSASEVMTIRNVLAQPTTVVSWSRAMDPLQLRFVIYRHFIETGLAPSRHELADVVGDLGAVDRLLRELHDRRMVVLDDRDERRGEIRPTSA